MITKVKIGTIELTPENGYYVSALRDLGYKTKYPVANIMYVHGSKLGDAYFENRQIAVELKVIGTSDADHISKRNELYKVLTINEFSTDKLTLSITLSTGIVLTMEGTLKDVSNDITSEMIGASNISFVLETETPFFKSEQLYQVDIPLTKGGGGPIPMTIPFDMSLGSGGYTQMTNGGNIFAYPTLTFYGNLTNPVLKNVTIDKTLSLAATIASPNYYSVDTFTRVIIDQSGVNKRDKMTGDFIVLATGLNRFSLLTDNPAETGFVRVLYQYFYISI